MAPGVRPDPEQLFAEYHALRSDPAASREQYEDLAERARAAKAAWKKAGGATEVQRVADLQNYLLQFKPREAADLLTPDQLASHLDSLSAKTPAPEETKRAVVALWRRLQETRAHLSQNNPSHDADHDELTDCEERLFDLASALGLDLTI
jgi:hypothetical protein